MVEETEKTAENVIPEIRIDQILKLLPHRYPFLLVDRLKEVVPGESGIGIKNVTMNEPFFQGHFPKIRLCRAFCKLKLWRKRRELLFCNLFPKKNDPATAFIL